LESPTPIEAITPVEFAPEINGEEEPKKYVRHKKTPSIQETELFTDPEVTEFGDQSGGDLNR